MELIELEMATEETKMDLGSNSEALASAFIVQSDLLRRGVIDAERYRSNLKQVLDSAKDYQLQRLSDYFPL